MKNWMKSHHILQMKTKTLNTYYIYDFSCKSFKTTEQREITVVEYFSHGWQNYACVLSRFSRVRLFATLWTVARQAPPSTGFSRQEYWSGLPFPPPGDLPDPEMEPTSLMSAALARRGSTTSDI